MQALARFISPAEAGHVAVPDQAVVVAARATFRIRPVQNLAISTAGKSALNNLLIRHAEKSTAPSVAEVRTRIPQIGDIVRRQFSGSMKPDLVEHSAGVNKTAHFCIG